MESQKPENKRKQSAFSKMTKIFKLNKKKSKNSEVNEDSVCLTEEEFDRVCQDYNSFIQNQQLQNEVTKVHIKDLQQQIVDMNNSYQDLANSFNELQQNNKKQAQINQDFVTKIYQLGDLILEQKKSNNNSDNNQVIMKKLEMYNVSNDIIQNIKNLDDASNIQNGQKNIMIDNNIENQSNMKSTCFNCQEDFTLNQENSCQYHPGKLLYYSCKGCGQDAYYQCCNFCTNCKKGCREGQHKKIITQDTNLQQYKQTVEEIIKNDIIDVNNDNYNNEKVNKCEDVIIEQDFNTFQKIESIESDMFKSIVNPTFQNNDSTLQSENSEMNQNEMNTNKELNQNKEQENINFQKQNQQQIQQANDDLQESGGLNDSFHSMSDVNVNFGSIKLDPEELIDNKQIENDKEEVSDFVNDSSKELIDQQNNQEIIEPLKQIYQYTPQQQLVKDYIQQKLQSLDSYVNDNYDGWENIYLDKKGPTQLKIYMKSYINDNKYRVNMFRQDWIAPCSSDLMFKIQNEIDIVKQTDTNAENIKEIDRFGENKEFQVLYLKYKKVMTVSPRDFVYVKYTQKLDNDSFIDCSSSINDYNIPEEKNVLRCQNLYSGSKIQKIDENCCRIMNFSEWDLQLNVPLIITRNTSAKQMRGFIDRCIAQIKLNQ